MSSKYKKTTIKEIIKSKKDRPWRDQDKMQIFNKYPTYFKIIKSGKHGSNRRKEVSLTEKGLKQYEEWTKKER